ncbi:unnamed protein product [Ranitomeya imitator]|uniref:DUF7886 domain-containing protein n=1 Tax=Ranitomeya imitator TaxID=111125 RepID=A0ABN9LG05_9NEOB|nr:unnamed protein product [Ranitomeya imitator]
MIQGEEEKQNGCQPEDGSRRLDADHKGLTPHGSIQGRHHESTQILLCCRPRLPAIEKSLFRKRIALFFLLAAYAKYGRPYVWVRSNHQRFLGTELCDKDSPLMLPSYSDWDTKDVGVWHIVWDVVSTCVSPPPRNPLAVDFTYLKSLPLPERSLSSGALVSFFTAYCCENPGEAQCFLMDPDCSHITAVKDYCETSLVSLSLVWEELTELTRLHALTLQDLKEQNLLKNLI